MLSSGKASADILVSLLKRHGIEEAVVSPGSRNAPVVTALLESGIKITVIIDERSAAFIALGKALDGKGVAMVCTSGTALLNYAPAVAEAYYRRVPLIVISADRPAEWIDQDDSQTLRQFEALDNFVKKSYNIPSKCDDDSTRWYINRIVNEAVSMACSQLPAGPVHINIQLDEPLNTVAPFRHDRWTDRMIGTIVPSPTLSREILDRLAGRINFSRRVMIIAGFGYFPESLSTSLGELAKRANIVVMTENIANLHAPDGVTFIESIDTTLSFLDEEMKRKMQPELVITFGGAIVSRFIKKYLREVKAEHWHIGMTDNVIDCMQSITEDIKMPPEEFFNQLNTALPLQEESDYSSAWSTIYTEAMRAHERYVDQSPWSDMVAMREVMRGIPDGTNVHLSNGTAIRYSMLFPVGHEGVRYSCNRGVSGIDGSVSTAMGDTREGRLTLLVTGDMSMQYDIGALATPGIGANFKIVVLCNGGGNIFRFIANTADHPSLEECFVVNRPFPLRQLAEAYGFSYREAMSQKEMRIAFREFIADQSGPAILALNTDGALSATILRNYFALHARS